MIVFAIGAGFEHRFLAVRIGLDRKLKWDIWTKLETQDVLGPLLKHTILP